MTKSAFTSSSFLLTAVNVLGIAIAVVSGITAPWALVAAPILTGVYTAANAYLKAKQLEHSSEAPAAAPAEAPKA